ncbi:DNA polymerase III, chi subunit [Waddlia chondrophila WSU 86-1044]|uniref:DNA polymerase III, chi subunit n=2 Tax=Waddlia chondrophila TaxID=71667 RepID=D6YW90_WADCW|nr:DNA polymerase III, chi subunit [Waddlia chondrophila WSU 86-1044]
MRFFKMNIRFLKTTDNVTKLRRISASVEHYFLKKKRVLITVPSETAATYLDDFLWKQPKEGFLPHSVSTQACSDEIVITTKQENLNQAEILINLCSEFSPIAGQFKTVFELWDETNALRREQSEKKFKAYEASGMKVELFRC